MAKEISKLLRESAKQKMTQDEIDEQCVSFVYGQMMDCQPDMTIEQVREILKKNQQGIAMKNGIWPHIRQELEDATIMQREVFLHLSWAFKAALAAMFGQVTHDGMAKTFRGTSYRIKR